MEEPQIRIGSDGELLEPFPTLSDKSKRKKRGSRVSSIAKRTGRLLAFSLAVTLITVFSYLVGTGIIDLTPENFTWYRQLCLNQLGKNKLAYLDRANGTIFLTDNSGTRSCPITYKRKVVEAGWMPDGSKLLFTTRLTDEFGYPSSAVQVESVNVDSTNQHTLIPGSDPFFSLSQLNFAGTYVIGRFRGQIYLVNTDTAAANIISVDGNLDSLVMAPDDLHFAIVSHHNDFRLSVSDSDGSNRQQLFNAKAPINQVMWSSDGKSILFYNYPNYYSINMDGSNLQTLTQAPPGTNVQTVSQPNQGPTANPPQWSPDGQFIAYVSDINGSATIYIRDADGNNIHQLPNILLPSLIGWQPQ